MTTRRPIDFDMDNERESGASARHPGTDAAYSIDEVIMAQDVEPARPRGDSARSDMGSGAAAVFIAVLLGLAAIGLVTFGQLPGLLLLLIAVPLAFWGSKRLRRAEAKVQ
jgi:hypothetical protein